MEDITIPITVTVSIICLFTFYCRNKFFASLSFSLLRILQIIFNLSCCPKSTRTSLIFHIPS